MPNFMHVNVCSSNILEILLISTSSYWWRRLISVNILSSILTLICILVLSHDLLITWLNLITPRLVLVCDAITRSSNQTPEPPGHVSVSLPCRPGPPVPGSSRSQLTCKTSSLTSDAFPTLSSSQEKGKQPLCHQRVVVFAVDKWFWFWIWFVWIFVKIN